MLCCFSLQPASATRIRILLRRGVRAGDRVTPIVRAHAALAAAAVHGLGLGTMRDPDGATYDTLAQTLSDLETKYVCGVPWGIEGCVFDVY